MKTNGDKYRSRIEAEDLVNDLKQIRAKLRAALHYTVAQKKVPQSVEERMRALLADVDLLFMTANDELLKLTMEDA